MNHKLHFIELASWFSQVRRRTWSCECRHLGVSVHSTRRQRAQKQFSDKANTTPQDMKGKGRACLGQWGTTSQEQVSDRATKLPQWFWQRKRRPTPRPSPKNSTRNGISNYLLLISECEDLINRPLFWTTNMSTVNFYGGAEGMARPEKRARDRLLSGCLAA